MSSQLAGLIILAPLLAALLVNIAGWIERRLCFPTALAAVSASLLAAVFLMRRVVVHGPQIYRLGGWDPPWGIAYFVDAVNGGILILVCLVGLINLVATRGDAAAQFENRQGAFYSLYLLFLTGLLGIVITGDLFNLYVLLEIASLTGYALIGMGGERSRISALNYVFMGTIGASLYLLGVGYLYITTGSLNIMDLAALLPKAETVFLVKVSFLLCLVGLFVKMAFFPLHSWLPNAYSHTANPCASLIAPLTTKVMLYVMVRLVLSVYGPEFAFDKLPIAELIPWLAVAAIAAGSVLAYKQTRLRRLLAYIIVVEVGYMVGGFWLGNAAGMTGAILHILNDAMMTLCIFLAAGAVAARHQADSFPDLQGLFRKMPFTMTAFVVAALSIIGVPPTCGFFSKWYLLTGSVAAGQYGFTAALVLSSLVNVLLFFKVIEIGYFEPLSDEGHHGGGPEAAAVREAPLDTLVPLLATAALLVAMGLYADQLVDWFIEPVILPLFSGGL
jgi:multicomponent Na+:H+ antiporter subunit D